MARARRTVRRHTGAREGGLQPAEALQTIWDSVGRLLCPPLRPASRSKHSPPVFESLLRSDKYVPFQERPLVVFRADEESALVNEMRLYIQSTWSYMTRAVEKALLTTAATKRICVPGILAGSLMGWNVRGGRKVADQKWELTTFGYRFSGEVNNEQRRTQRLQYLGASDRRGTGGWVHDGIMDVLLQNKWYHVPLRGSRRGSMHKGDEAKCEDDKTKLFKARLKRAAYLHAGGVAQRPGPRNDHNRVQNAPPSDKGLYLLVPEMTKFFWLEVKGRILTMQDRVFEGDEEQQPSW
ncbi:hypothetical protein HDU85_002118 [Gaertneriomyces sp. JEL0708]|nr:hypothetical protein HDU85_002118 [Gaertneriomyces sp. JEL0708]